MALGVVAGLALAIVPSRSCADDAPARGNPIAEAYPLIFDSEWIRLEIVGDSLEVRGTYWLLCRSAIEHPTPLFYPFPVDSLLGGARMVSLAFRTGTGSLTPGRWQELQHAPGVRWWLPPCASRDSIVAESVYRQQIRESYARYIVTTTKIWGRPLRRARFEIRLPAGAEPLEFSFPFERRAAEVNGEEPYVYEARDFLPDEDIVVRWRR